MNLLCPSCQNPLAVPEQYAGQLMKCPLCGNNFTVPALAPTPAAAAEPSLAYTSGPSPAMAPEEDSHDFTPIELSGHIPPPVSPPPPSTDRNHGTYGLTPEAARPAPPPLPPPPPRPAAPVAPTAPPAGIRPAPPSPPRPTAAGGYTHTVATTLHPRSLRLIAPVCLVLVFVLSLFPWVGVYLGGNGIITQNAWGAAFGATSVDTVFDFHEKWEEKTPAEDKPGPDWLMILFLLFGLIPAVVVGLGAVALPRLMREFKLPPGLAQIEPWRWLIVSGVTLLALLFLFLQLVTSFSIEAKAHARVARTLAKENEKATNNEIKAKWNEIKGNQDYMVAGLRRTVSLRLSFILLLLAAAGAAGAHWLDQRGPDRPLPRFEVHW
jgi:hypothetical protein